MESLKPLPKAASKPVGPTWATDEFFYAAVDDFKRDALFFDKTCNEPISYRLRKGFHTACWAFRDGCHYVFLGTGILRNGASHVAALTPEQGKEYLKKFLGHEYGHALWTLRNVASFSSRLQRAGIPFSLWNLFEDSRIESLKRIQNKFEFDWLSFEKQGSTTAAEALFFLCVQAEGDLALVRSLVRAANATGEQIALCERVIAYFLRAIACKNSTDLYPLLKEWVAEFGATQDAQDSGGAGEGQGLQDLELSYELMSNQDKFDEFMEESIDMDAPLDMDPPELPEDLKGVEPDLKERSFNSVDFLSSCPASQKGFDSNRVSQVAETLKRVTAEVRIKRFSDQPTKRFNARRDLLNLPAYRQEPMDLRPKLNLMVFLDCSGSMQGKPMSEAKILLGALSLLAVRNRLTGYVVLTTSTYTKNCYHRFKFPLSPSELESIHAMNGGEGLEPAIMDPENLRLTAQARSVYVITDANITDAPIDKGELHKRGIYTTGIYVGNKGDTRKMEKYFDSYLIRDSIEDIVLALLDTLK